MQDFIFDRRLNYVAQHHNSHNLKSKNMILKLGSVWFVSVCILYALTASVNVADTWDDT